jgi:hypothetical protein
MGVARGRRVILSSLVPLSSSEDAIEGVFGLGPEGVATRCGARGVTIVSTPHATRALWRETDLGYINWKQLSPSTQSGEKGEIEKKKM